jgi:hypothetical protein
VFRKHSEQELPSSRKSSSDEKTTSSHPSSRRTSSSSSQLECLTMSRTPLGFDSLSPRKGSLILDAQSPRRTADLRQTCSPVHGEHDGLRRASIIKDPASRKSSSGLDSRKSSSSLVRVSLYFFFFLLKSNNSGFKHNSVVFAVVWK